NVSVVDIAIVPGMTYDYYVKVYDLNLDRESELSATVQIVVSDASAGDGMPEDEVDPMNPEGDNGELSDPNDQEPPDWLFPDENSPDGDSTENGGPADEGSNEAGIPNGVPNEKNGSR